MRKRLAKIEFALFLTCTLVGASAALTAVGAPAAGSNAELSEVLLSTSFEETWVLDEDGDYKAPPGWDVDGICVGYQDELYQWLTHYWSDLTDTESLPAFDLSHSGVTSACVWWSNGYGESEMVGTRQSEWLITPTLDLSRYASVNLSFWSIYCWDPLYSNNSNYVKISVDNGGSWETIADLTHEARWRLGGDLPDWENWNCYQYPINIDLSQYVGEPLVKIAWHYQFPGEGGHAIWVVDDVKVSGVPDVTPPFVSIEKPGKAFYFNDKEVFPFFTPLVVGQVNVTVSAVDNETRVSYVEFLVNNETKKVVDAPPFVWTWSETLFGRFTLQVKAFDLAGNSVTKELVVWKFF